MFTVHSVEAFFVIYNNSFTNECSVTCVSADDISAILIVRS